MADPIFLVIGGEQVTIPPIMNFATLERAWPCIRAWNTAADEFDREVAAIGMISAALITTRPDLTPMEIKNKLASALFDEAGIPLAASERVGLLVAANALLFASGLVRAGEVVPPEAPAADPTS